MRVNFRQDEHWDKAPANLGIHVYASGVSINPEAEGSYLSFQHPQPGALFRLRRDGMTVVRDPVTRGREEDNARWWFAEELGNGDYQAIVGDAHGRTQVVYVGIGEDGRFWTMGEDATEFIEFQFSDVAVDKYPDFAALAAALPTSVEG